MELARFHFSMGKQVLAMPWRSALRSTILNKVYARGLSQSNRRIKHFLSGYLPPISRCTNIAPNGLGLALQDMSIPPHVVSAKGILDGDIVQGIAIASFNKKRGNWGMKAVRAKSIARNQIQFGNEVGSNYGRSVMHFPPYPKPIFHAAIQPHLSWPCSVTRHR